MTASCSKVWPSDFPWPAVVSVRRWTHPGVASSAAVMASATSFSPSASSGLEPGWKMSAWMPSRSQRASSSARPSQLFRRMAWSGAAALMR